MVVAAELEGTRTREVLSVGLKILAECVVQQQGQRWKGILLFVPVAS